MSSRDFIGGFTVPDYVYTPPEDDRAPVWCCGGYTAIWVFDEQYGEVWHCSACGTDYADE
jgi:hypothetical protein